MTITIRRMMVLLGLVGTRSLRSQGRGVPQQAIGIVVSGLVMETVGFVSHLENVDVSVGKR